MFVRFSAACLMAIGLLDVCLYLAQCLLSKPPAPVRVLPVVLNAIPCVLGVVVLVKARAIAGWISDQLE